jgi:ENTS family enterobactin (siderophore) exporter
LVYQSLGVAYTTDVLAGGQRDLGANYLGAFQAAIGLGSVVGVLSLTALAATQPARVLLGTSVVFSLALMGLGSTSHAGVAIALGAVIGATQFAGSNVTMALVQHHSPEEMRGRVTSLSMVAFVGVFPFTSFAFGYLAEAIGTRATFLGCGVACLVVALGALRWVGSIRMPEPVVSTIAA